jgi:hydrogenase maturation protease
LKPILVLCLGNELLTDDRFGAVVAQRLQTELTDAPQVEIIFAPLAGFALLDLLHDRKYALVVDTILTGKSEPGTITFLPGGITVPTKNLTCSHQASLPTIVGLAQQMSIPIPTQIDVIAVEAEDVYTLGEQMTPKVALAIDDVFVHITDWINQQIEELSHDLHRKPADAIA